MTYFIMETPGVLSEVRDDLIEMNIPKISVPYMRDSYQLRRVYTIECYGFPEACESESHSVESDSL